MNSVEAESKARLFAIAERTLGARVVKRWYVPGRIEVLGKHTDYAGGPSLVCAVERGICVATWERHDSLVRVIDVVRGLSAEFPLSAEIPVPERWSNYVATVVRRVARNFPSAKHGADIVIASDLPQSAGLSSSSALIVAVFTALASANRLEEQPEFHKLAAEALELAAYLACVENGQSYGEFTGDRGVGTFGGSEDHTAILCSRTGQLGQYRFCPVRLERQVPFPDDWTFVIASSGIRASKAGAAREQYNRVSLTAKAVLESWNTASGKHAASLREAIRLSESAADEIREALRRREREDFSAEDLLTRFEHYVVESALAGNGADAFAAGDGARLGDIVDRSQKAAEQMLGNQVPETMALARSAREMGAIAASAFGAGFGGSVWAVVQSEDAKRFLFDWRNRYVRDFPVSARHSEFFVTGAGPGMMRI